MPEWKKSSSSSSFSNCVEVASLPDGEISVRDSKYPGPRGQLSRVALPSAAGTCRAPARTGSPRG